MNEAGETQRIVIGRIAGVFGVKGWVKVESFTRPPENILRYARWRLGMKGQWREMRVVQAKPHRNGFVAQLEDEAGDQVADRDAAAALVRAEVVVLRSELPPPGKGEYYGTDLIGLEVRHVEGQVLGRVTSLMETGANDVLVVRNGRDRLIPFVRGPIVKEVDLQTGIIRVDWHPDF